MIAIMHRLLARALKHSSRASLGCSAQAWTPKSFCIVVMPTANLPWDYVRLIAENSFEVENAMYIAPSPKSFTNVLSIIQANATTSGRWRHGVEATWIHCHQTDDYNIEIYTLKCQRLNNFPMHDWWKWMDVCGKLCGFLFCLLKEAPLKLYNLSYISKQVGSICFRANLWWWRLFRKALLSTQMRAGAILSQENVSYRSSKKRPFWGLSLPWRSKSSCLCLQSCSWPSWLAWWPRPRRGRRKHSNRNVGPHVETHVTMVIHHWQRRHTNGEVFFSSQHVCISFVVGLRSWLAGCTGRSSLNEPVVATGFCVEVTSVSQMFNSLTLSWS